MQTLMRTLMCSIIVGCSAHILTRVIWISTHQTCKLDTSGMSYGKSKGRAEVALFDLHPTGGHHSLQLPLQATLYCRKPALESMQS